MSSNIVDAAQQRRVPVSRRSAIRTGAIATLVSGLLGAAGTSEASATAQTTAPTVILVNYPGLAEASLAAAEKYARAMELHEAGASVLRQELGHETWWRVSQHMDGPFADILDAWNDVLLTELVRHSPAVAPLLAMLRDHISETSPGDWGRCCVPEIGGLDLSGAVTD